jgi:zinc finger BED domain-containing protein 1 (E3 SUMO-protein ligase ZBED1)
MKYPLLAKLARKLLAVPASTAAVERVFSETGYIMRPHRRRLADKQAENLFFLKCNMEFFKWETKKTYNLD